MLKHVVFDLQVPMYKALMAEVPGAASITLADAWASPPMVSVKILRDIVAAWFFRLRDELGIGLANIGVWGSSYLKGANRDEFMDIVTRMLGVTAVFDPDQERDGVKYYRDFASKAGALFVAGFSTAALLEGPVDAVIARAKKYTLEGKAGPTPFMFLFSNIAPRTPVDHVRAAIAAAKIFGAPGAGESTAFTPPSPAESFGDFLKKKIRDNPEGYRFGWLEKSGWKDEVKR
jgi:hypothetical protein